MKVFLLVLSFFSQFAMASDELISMYNCHSKVNSISEVRVEYSIMVSENAIRDLLNKTSTKINVSLLNTVYNLHTDEAYNPRHTMYPAILDVNQLNNDGFNFLITANYNDINNTKTEYKLHLFQNLKQQNLQGILTVTDDRESTTHEMVCEETAWD